MFNASTNPMMRALIVLFGVMAGILAFAIYIAANSPTHARAVAASSEDKAQADEARKAAAEHLKSLDEANADLRKQLEVAKTGLHQQAERLAAAEQEGLRLRSDLNAALKRIADLNRKDADELVKAGADSAAKPAAENAVKGETVKKETEVKAVQAPTPEVDVTRGRVPDAGNRKRARKNVSKPAPVAVESKAGPSFSELDSNQDGKLSLEEYKAGYPNVADVEKEFKALDTNGDGFLSIDEYQAGHPVPPLPKKKRPSKKN